MFEPLLFFFSIPTPPANPWDLSAQLADIRTRVLSLFQAPLLVEAFLLDSISFENKQKARYTYS